RLMAAVLPGEESALVGSGSRPDRNGIGLIYCFICGGGVTPGKELKLQVKYQRENYPFFPFLQHQEPAPGAEEVTLEGCVLVCAVCQSFLGEQWNSFERSRTPIEKRMYWLKRPYQCDSRRIPQEWNISYDLERRISVSSQNFDAPESDLSSLSENENMSDQEFDFGDRPGLIKEKCLRMSTSSKTPKRSHKAADVGDAAAALSPVGASSTPDRDFVDVQKGDEPRRANDSGSNSDAAGGRSDSDSNEINITSDDDREVFDLGRERVRALNRQKRESGSVIAKPQSSTAAEESACYICGSKLSPANQYRVYVQKQERTSNEPFFPFLWLHSPPPGAVALSPAGCTLVCACCHSSLMQQWQGFELASVPVLQRLYVVPLNPGVSGQEPRPPESCKPEPVREACFLCGQDCSEDVKVICAKVGAGSSTSTMHFPFINLLPCPPKARGVKNGKVHCCQTCYTILEDIWAAYRLCLSEELITSVSTFLGRYHQAVTGAAIQASSFGHPAPRRGHTAVCYLCGAELAAGVEFQLHVNPPGRCGEREPFFPFLTVQPPAPRARPADSTGLVSTCLLCYHDLLGQWVQHERRAGQPASSPWSRQYSCETFVCFFCRQEKRRCLGLKMVHVARLPVFLYAPRVSNTLVVDDGKKLTI
uniref:Genetic suppressor element 1 n=1 Tax=Lepisosteus oculatus TaxID=7918 RepID=W5LXU6_LEPOC